MARGLGRCPQPRGAREWPSARIAVTRGRGRGGLRWAFGGDTGRALVCGRLALWRSRGLGSRGGAGGRGRSALGLRTSTSSQHDEQGDEEVGRPHRRSLPPSRPTVWASGAALGTFGQDEHGGYSALRRRAVALSCDATKSSMILSNRAMISSRDSPKRDTASSTVMIS